MSRNDYNRMYRKERENEETLVSEEAVKDTVPKNAEVEKKEPVKKEKKVTYPKDGKVIGGASLNVRSNPTPVSAISTTITSGTPVVIEAEAGDFYNISRPVSGFVMKKFVEV